MQFSSTFFGHLIGELQTLVVNGIKGQLCKLLFLMLLYLVTTFYTYPDVVGESGRKRQPSEV